MQMRNTLKTSRYIFLTLLVLSPFSTAMAEDGYRLWLRYDVLSDSACLAAYQKSVVAWMVEGDSPILQSAARELETGLRGVFGRNIPRTQHVHSSGVLVAGTPAASRIIAALKLDNQLAPLGDEGYLLLRGDYKGKKIIAIAANSDRGVLYGVFHFFRLLQTQQNIDALKVATRPTLKIRVLNHWDNLDRSVERGYAGRSLWEWESLPQTLTPRYRDYARANASIGINGTVLTNVNANAQILTREYLLKVAALADVFRPYNIKVYLTARFSAPVEIGGLATADPLAAEVIAWWQAKADELYALIPDFGGFLIKANSEGQPGPQNYGRSHADGANLLAAAVAPHGGIVMWRAFVYDNDVPDDRAKQAYNEFVPLDGHFHKNVLIQVKNGPIDFQPREPFHPLFGALPGSAVMPELQITQEYLGASVHLVYLAPLFSECLQADTHAAGAGSTVARVIDGTLFPHEHTAMAGVANAGEVQNWSGHPFGQANWFAFGRLAWNPDLEAQDIAREWIRMTFSNDENAVETICGMMMASREIAVNYMTPLGLHHIMYADHHYGPGPWVDHLRRDWTSVYYHRADSIGIGFDRTTRGSDAVSQYHPHVRDLYDDIDTCPENLLLWFHHVPWDHKMKSGRTLWEEMCHRYDAGVKSVGWLRSAWQSIKATIDQERFALVETLLAKQERDARIWRDGCLLYFQTFSKQAFPDSMAPPAHDLEYYIRHYYDDIPGIE